MAEKSVVAAEKEIPADATILTADIGGSKLMVGFVSAAGEVLCVERYEWLNPTAEEILDKVESALRAQLEAHPDLAARVIAGGLTIPGLAEPVKGVWLDSDFPPIRDLHICEELSERLGIPFYGDNDGNACVLAEGYFGSARGASDFIYITVSSGVGGGACVGGELFYGAHCESGEIGLTICEQDGRPSRSGKQHGPLEMYCCTEGMSQTFIELGGPSEVDGHAPGGKEIAACAEKGNEAALRTIELEGKRLGRAIACADALLAPEVVVLGGGISLMLDRFAPALEAELKRIRPQGGPRVVASELGYQGAFLGAAACGLRGAQGFSHPLGAGGDDACALVITRDDKNRVRCELIADDKPVVGADCARGGELGGYLVAQGVDDEGSTLDEVFSEVDIEALVESAQAGDEGAAARLAALGDTLGRAVAFASMLFDPGTIRVGNGLSLARDFIEQSFVEAVVRETYYLADTIPYVFTWE